MSVQYLQTLTEPYFLYLGTRHRIHIPSTENNFKCSKSKEKSEKCRKLSNLAAKLDSRWHVSRLENVANVVVNALKERKA
ncbi:hypothetical protein Tco_1158456 [Tanacetum coccineum]